MNFFTGCATGYSGCYTGYTGCRNERICQNGNVPIRALQYTESGQLIVGFSNGNTCCLGSLCKCQNIIFSQTEEPSTYICNQPIRCGEIFINLATGIVYQYNGLMWVIIGNSQGQTGPTGPTGLAGLTGSIGPTGPTEIYAGTGLFGLNNLDTLDNVISSLRQPNTFYPGFFGAGIGTDATRIPDYDAIVLGNHNDATGPNNANYAVAIGYYSGQLNQSSGAIAIGYQSGYNVQNIDTIAIGNQAGYAIQGSGSIAIGQNAGNLNQETSAIAIGEQAGFTSQGGNSIAIGNMAGYSGQASNSIVISAAGSAINNTNPSSCVVYPIRNVNGTASNRLYWDLSTNEITHGTEPSSIKYKQNVTTIPQKYIDGIYQLHPVEFSFKTCPEKRQIGLIAEEVDKIMPEVVVQNDIVIQGINYKHLVAPLIDIIKQYKNIINLQEIEINDCETRLLNLELLNP